MLSEMQKQIILKYRPRRYSMARLARIINTTESEVVQFVNSLPRKEPKEGKQPKRVADPTPEEIINRKAIQRAIRTGPIAD